MRKKDKPLFTQDRLYQHPDLSSGAVVDFAFDEKVASVFPDMVQRSIPGYATLLTVMQAVFRAEFKNRHDLLVYDLGCSVGGTLTALLPVMPLDTRFIGMDTSPEMIDKARGSCAQACARLAIQEAHANINARVQLQVADVVQTPLQACDAICLNFTLQFLKKPLRQSVLDRCYAALKSKGLLLIAEKTQASPETIAWHEQFKRNNGYSELEIAGKRSAIEQVMQIDSASTIEARLQQAGFTEIVPIFQALAFRAWVATR